MKLPLPKLADMLVDHAHGRVYFTGGEGTDRIVVTDLDGANLSTIDTIPGPAGMTLSPDGTKLYVAASQSDGIMVIDTATARSIGWYWTGFDDGRLTCPTDVAWAAGQLWFSWGCDDQATPTIGQVNPSTRSFVLHAVNRLDSRFTSPPMLATVPSQPNMVIAGEAGNSGGQLVRFQASPTELNQEALASAGGFVRHLAITPDGSRVIVPTGSP